MSDLETTAEALRNKYLEGLTLEYVSITLIDELNDIQFERPDQCENSDGSELSQGQGEFLEYP